MKKILLNASQKEEVRLAVVENNKLTELDIDFPSRNIKSNIYKGVISRVEPSLEAAFINFGRKRHNLTKNEIKKLIIDQYEILQNIADKHNMKVTHIKPHGALNNMACEDIDLANTLAKTIKEISKDLIYLVPTGSKMEEAAKKLDMKIACEIFADRNYEDDGNLVSRKKSHALITDPEEAKKPCFKYVRKSGN